MGTSEYVINVLCAFLAVEYIDYGFPKKYRGAKRWGLFAAGCLVYFLVVTGLNRMTEYEGFLGFLYGAVLIGYGLCALEGKWREFLIAGLLWVLIAIVGTYATFSIMGLFTGKSLEGMLLLDGGRLFYASLVALMVKFSMGKIAVLLFCRREGDYDKENGIIAGVFLCLALLAMGLFWLEAGNQEAPFRYVLTIGILADEIGIVLFLAGMYHRLGRYQREKMEEQHRREREQERLEGLMDLYRVGREINHWRHDMQSELEVLYRLQKNKKYAQVEARMEKLCDGLGDYPDMPQPTGNEGLDAALLKMIPKCREKGIRFRYIILGKPSQIDSITFGNLMNNLLSNGMEACQELTDEREIELIVQTGADGVEISLENSIGESVLKKNPQLQSGKRDRTRHGFGMESISRIVEEHDGTYECWEEENKGKNRFFQRIYLRYEKKGC